MPATLWMASGQGDEFAQWVYWTDVLNGKIQSCNLDGSDIRTFFDTVSVLPPGFTQPARPTYLAVDPSEGYTIIAGAGGEEAVAKMNETHNTKIFMTFMH